MKTRLWRDGGENERERKRECHLPDSQLPWLTVTSASICPSPVPRSRPHLSQAGTHRSERQSLTKEGKTLANNANRGFPENKPDLHDLLFSWASPTQSAAYEHQSASAKCSRPEQCMMGRLCKKRPTAFGTPSICPYNHGSSLFDSFQ